MKATLVGCNGYLGKHLMAFLQKKGWDIFAYDKDKIPTVQTSYYESLELLDKGQIDKVNTEVDFIFYFAGITGTLRAYEDYETYINVNEVGLLNLLDLIKNRKSRARIIFPSTRLVYKGQENTPLKEGAPKEFKTIYALNKWFGEQVIHQYHMYFGIPYNIFRICVPYGNVFSDVYSYGTIGFMLNQARQKHNIRLFGTGQQKRTFTHVQDICHQITQVIEAKESHNQIFNIDGEIYSLSEVANDVAVKFGISVEYTAWPELDEKAESGDTIFDAAKIRQIVSQPIHHKFKNWINTVR